MRNILAVFAGIAIGFATVPVAAGIGHWVTPATPETLPLGVKLALLTGLGLGIFLGVSGALYVSRGLAWTGWAVTLAMSLLTLYILVLIPHPVWMTVGVLLVIPAGWLGAQKTIRLLRP